MVTSPDEPDTAPTATNFDVAGGNISTAISYGAYGGPKSTNTSAQLGIRANVATQGYNGWTNGWIDWRRSMLFILFCPVAANDNRRRRRDKAAA